MGLGDVYYKIALFDMIRRNQFRQSPVALVILTPDIDARDLLLETKRLLENAAHLKTTTRRTQDGSMVKLFSSTELDDQLRRVNVLVELAKKLQLTARERELLARKLKELEVLRRTRPTVGGRTRPRGARARRGG